MLSYDELNRQLNFVTDFFAATLNAVVQVRWESGVKHGKRIRPGTRLATVFWSDGTETAMTCPAGCSGIIDATNRCIDYMNLPFPPVQHAVRLM